jgi:hypothetical protein
MMGRKEEEKLWEGRNRWRGLVIGNPLKVEMS